MKYVLRSGIWVLIIAVVGALAFCLLRPAGRSLSREQILQLQSDVQLKGISKLVLNFEASHEGRTPGHLSDIVPDNRIDLLEIFYAPGERANNKPSGWSTNKELIDLSSDYILEPYGKSNVIVHEKPGLWSDNTIGVIVSNLTVVRINSSNLDLLLKTSYFPHPQNAHMPIGEPVH